MNRNIALLKPYPFERLNALKAGILPAKKTHIALSMGEPTHLPPRFVMEKLTASLDRISFYPKTKGIPELRQAIAHWLEKRFNLQQASIDAEHQILPLNGTREGLFSFIQAAIDKKPGAKILMPNPFYQIYEGGALLAGAEPVFLNCLAENNYLPDFDKVDEKTWHDCQLLVICSPGNPTGAVMPQSMLKKLIMLADKHDFIIASDECYSEIYFDEANPPTGLLEACAALGRHSYERCVVFHSLSKRSNLPGLRSGFIAGDKEILRTYLQYRTYHGCVMPEPTQLASVIAWQDEKHVIENRSIYTRKFRRTLEVLDGCLDVSMPDAAFYLWPKLPVDDEKFCQALFEQQNITALPGQYLSRDSGGMNPGFRHARLALVASEQECVDAAQRIRDFIEKNYR